MSQLVRYGRAFFKALELTLRGEQITQPQSKYPHLDTWIAEGQRRVEAVLKAADANNLDETKRKTIILNLDRRDISMQTILGAIEHNMLREYPMLLQTDIEHNLTALHALNMNDQYRIAQLVELESLPPAVQSAVQLLLEHIQHVPSSETQNEPT